MIPGMPIDGQPIPHVDDLQDDLLQDDLAGSGNGRDDIDDIGVDNRIGGILFGPNIFARAGFLLTRFPMGLFWFLVIVIGLSVGLGTIVIIIGLPTLIGLFHLLRAGARFERHLVGLAGGPTLGDPYRKPPDGAPAGKRWRTRLTDPATYRDLLYLLLQFPFGLFTFVITVVTLSVTVGALAVPLFYNRLGSARISFFGDTDSSVFVVDRLWKALLVAGVGLILLPLLPLATRALSALHFGLAKLLLGPTRYEEVTGAQVQRDLGLAADMTERKRIERDLHDGAQQRLVAMTMELGRARAKLDDDPDSARELLDSAHGHAKAAMQELRDLARGISPPLLSDRGLDAALSALAARSPIPVDLTIELERRLPESVESTAYFVIAEAMTNAVKHSKAKVITVRVMDHAARLSVSVSDNGLGGVDPTGSGVMGLADRVRSVGGDFMARNRDGGAAGGGFAGVEILAEIPCGS